MVARMERLRLLARQLSWVLLTLPQRSHRYAAKVFRAERLYFSTKRKADASCRNSKTTSTRGLTVRYPQVFEPECTALVLLSRKRQERPSLQPRTFEKTQVDEN